MRLFALFLCGCGLAMGQPREFRASAPWIVENWRHAEIPDPRPPEPPREPLLQRLDDLQHAAQSIVREARLAGNYWAAADAVREARANLALAAELAARPLYLLALNDRAVHAASAYWVEGGDLHYLAPDGRPSQVPLDKVDRARTERLNRAREVEVRLPEAAR